MRKNIVTAKKNTKLKRPAAARPTGGGVSRARKKLVSRATLKGFIREMHGHARPRGEGTGLVRFFSDFPVTWFLDDP